MLFRSGAVKDYVMKDAERAHGSIEKDKERQFSAEQAAQNKEQSE